MLILTRRPVESVICVVPAGTRLPDGKVLDKETLITITTLGVKGNQVRIGINAPKWMAVHREEIWERIKAEQATGNRSLPGDAQPALGHAG